MEIRHTILHTLVNPLVSPCNFYFLQAVYKPPCRFVSSCRPVLNQVFYPQFS